MTSVSIASAKQLLLSLAPPEDEARAGSQRKDAPVGLPNLLERALERSNMFRALRRVRRNQGAPGVDGMTVDELPGYLKEHWPKIRAALLKRRGVSVELAWNTAKSAHGPWRLSQSPALTIALPAKYFRELGLPSLVNG